MTTIPDSDYTTEFVVERTPHDVYEAINDIPAWWMTHIHGSNSAVGDEFSFEVPGVHACTMRVAQLVPDRRIVWRVTRSNMTFVAEPEEWVGTDITFEVIPDGDGSRVRFTHLGLSPSDGCYEVCSSAWDHSIRTSLHASLATGVGQRSSDPMEAPS
jgi:uncharacterized protein YndB with AHSA1/START domain